MSNKKILFLSPYPVNKAPSQRLKYEQYYGYFEEMGYEITTSSFVSLSFWNIYFKKGQFWTKVWYTLMGYLRRVYDLGRIRNYDVVYVHLWATPFGITIFEWLIVKLAKVLIYDIDDLIFLKYESKANPIAKLLKSRRNSILLMQNAHHVITCTPYLDSFVKQYNTKTTDISSTINTTLYRPKTDYEIKDNQLILGWSGSYSTSQYLYLLKDVFLKLKEEIDFKLLVMGDEKFAIEGIEIEAIPWKEAHEVSTISRFDIGLYPLPIDEEWVLGKSGLKALQYMSLGVPTIATAVGANFRVIENDESGYLVKTNEEWLAQIKKLANNISERKRLGKNAVNRVENHFSINANKTVYWNVLQQATAAAKK